MRLAYRSLFIAVGLRILGWFVTPASGRVGTEALFGKTLDLHDIAWDVYLITSQESSGKHSNRCVPHSGCIS